MAPIDNHSIVEAFPAMDLAREDNYEFFNSAQLYSWYKNLPNLDNQEIEKQVASFLPRQGGRPDFSSHSAKTFLYYSYLLFLEDVQNWLDNVATDHEYRTIESALGLSQGEMIDLKNAFTLEVIITNHMPKNEFGENFLNGVSRPMSTIEVNTTLRPLSLGVSMYEGLRRNLSQEIFDEKQLHDSASGATAEFLIKCIRKTLPLSTNIGAREDLDLVLQKKTPYGDLAKGDLPTLNELTNATKDISVTDLIKLFGVLQYKGSDEKFVSSFGGIKDSDIRKLDEQLGFLETIIINKLTEQLSSIDHKNRNQLLTTVGGVVKRSVDKPVAEFQSDPPAALDSLKNVKFSTVERDRKTIIDHVSNAVKVIFSKIFKSGNKSAETLAAAATVSVGKKVISKTVTAAKASRAAKRATRLAKKAAPK